jgi:hypothetical protein
LGRHSPVTPDAPTGRAHDVRGTHGAALGNLSLMGLRQQVARALGIGIVAFGVGAMDSLVKGNGYGIIGALSETVVPWFVLAFLAGAYTKERRFLLGAVAGLEATMCGLVGFYFVNSFLFNFGMVTWLANFHAALLTGAVPFELGVVSGLLFGVLGVWWKERLSIVPVVGLGVAFVLEAMVRAMEAANFYYHGHAVGLIESFVGLVWIALAVYVTMALRRKPQ